MPSYAAYRPFRQANVTLRLRNLPNGRFGSMGQSPQSYYRPPANPSMARGAQSYSASSAPITGTQKPQQTYNFQSPSKAQIGAAGFNFQPLQAAGQSPNYTFDSLLGGLKGTDVRQTPINTNPGGGVPIGPAAMGGDPSAVMAAYGAIQAQAQKDIAQARAAALDNERQTLLGFGSQELARAVLGGSDPILGAINDNPDTGTSTLAQLNYAARKNQYNFNEGENQNNLWYSGARGSGLSQLGHQKITDIASATRGIQGQITGIKQALQQAESAYNERMLEAALAMAQWQYANGGGNSGNGNGNSGNGPGGPPNAGDGNPTSGMFRSVAPRYATNPAFAHGGPI